MARTRWVVRWPRPISTRIDRRTFAITVASLMLALIVGFLTLIGHQPQMAVSEVFAAFRGHADPAHQFVITTVRLPRAIVALIVGAALGMSGAIFQGIVRNALVTPDIIGVNSGAAAVVVLVIVAQPTGAVPQLNTASLCGALAAAVLVYWLSDGAAMSRLKLVLVGVGVNALLGSVILFILDNADLDQFAQVSRYLIGDLSAGASWPTVRHLLLPCALLMGVATALGHWLALLQHDDDTIVGLGLRVPVVRLVMLLVGTGLAAFAVVPAGPIGFVAFVAPLIARRLAHSSGPGTLPLAAATGAALMVFADLVAQYIYPQTEFPVGIITILLGAPVFAVMLLRRSRAG